MADSLPLLMFPKAVVKAPPKVNPRPIPKIKRPSFAVQSARLGSEFDQLSELSLSVSATLNETVSGLEPEAVLVLEVLGSVADFQAAVERTGLDWIGEIEVDSVEPNDDFYWPNKEGEPTDKLISKRLFLSITNQAGLNKVLSLWAEYKAGGKKYKLGLTKWRDVFDQLHHIRRWGFQETLIETEMLGIWRDLVNPLNPAENISFQIEFFYRKTPELRRNTELAITTFLARLGGKVLGVPIDIEEIAFHAIKATVPGTVIEMLVKQIDANDLTNRLGLFFFSGIMYFRPTGQSYFTIDDNGSKESVEFKNFIDSEGEPVAAIFDGAPLFNHQAIKGRVLLDDVFDVVSLYVAGERRHGTSMASLVIRGDLNDPAALPLEAPIYFVPIMQPDVHNNNVGRRNEHVPTSIFLEDRIHVAVRRLFERVGDNEPAAPTVKVISLSIGDASRPFLHMASPLARLLDWLSWRYRVLFCVSAGNYSDDVTLNVSHLTFVGYTDAEKGASVIRSMADSLSQRRMLSPAESINSITVAATHTDFSPQPPNLTSRIDIVLTDGMFSPLNRLGAGFRNAIKPDILMAGGKQFYRTPISPSGSTYQVDPSTVSPGVQVATDSSAQATLNATTYSRGTSNANALATRGAVRIEQMLRQLSPSSESVVLDSLTTVLLKALLVHGAKQNEAVQKLLKETLRTKTNGKLLKRLSARFMGYGETDIDRVLACAKTRATAIASAEITENEIHEYSFPIPSDLANTEIWRRLTITLAWFTPINPKHANLREAKLEFGDGGESWTKGILNLAIEDADHNQIKRGTVQHKILAGQKEIKGYLQGESIRIHVACKKDATEVLAVKIPYALAVTLEVKAGVQARIYEQVKLGLAVQVKARVGV